MALNNGVRVEIVKGEGIIFIFEYIPIQRKLANQALSQEKKN